MYKLPTLLMFLAHEGLVIDKSSLLFSVERVFGAFETNHLPLTRTFLVSFYLKNCKHPKENVVIQIRNPDGTTLKDYGELVTLEAGKDILFYSHTFKDLTFYNFGEHEIVLYVNGIEYEENHLSLSIKEVQVENVLQDLVKKHFDI